MERWCELVVDNESPLGRTVTSAVVIAVGIVLAMVVGRIAANRADDAYSRYYARKAVR